MTTKTATRGNYTAEQRMRFAAGRRRRNARMQTAAEFRRFQLAGLLAVADVTETGWQSRLAEQLDVHRSTITRDLRIIRSGARQRRLDAAEDDLDRRFMFGEMLQRSFDPDQTRQRLLRERSEMKKRKAQP